MKRNLMLSLLLITAMPSFSPFAHAEMQLSRFEKGSYKKIITQYQGNSFLMVLWSVDCPPCIEELPVLGKIHQLHPNINIVMVSTDSENQRKDIKQLMHKYGLNDIQQWVFSGDSVQAIRFAIDPIWYGELPRSYFHHDKNKRQVKTGRLDEATLLVWIKEINNRKAGL